MHRRYPDRGLGFAPQALKGGEFLEGPVDGSLDAGLIAEEETDFILIIGIDENTGKGLIWS